MRTLEEKILQRLEHTGTRPQSRRDLAERLNLRGAERKLLNKVLRQLVRSGLVDERKGGYLLNADNRTIEGEFSQAEQGYGFLRQDDPGKEDLFIPARHVGSAMNGDRVLVRRRLSSRDGRPYGEVIKVLVRQHGSLLGTYRRVGRHAEVWPLDPTLGDAVRVPVHESAENSEIVVVEMERYAVGGIQASGRVVEVLGPADDPFVDIKAVIRSHGLPHLFSENVLAEAETSARVVSAADLAGRVDLRAVPLVTIDGETAKDFDDAVALEKRADGTFRLWVCIADVAHYVFAGGRVDREALERGTSVYFPGYCVPMLPEVLSNGICSLNPQQDRLVMCAEMIFDPQGQRLEEKFYPAVMCSQARLTYTQVFACLDNPETSELPVTLQQQLLQMGELSAALTEMRRKRGSLDLDVPEAEILLDKQGRPYGLEKIERNLAHRLIEEFMLAANEAVAAFLERKGRAFLYRIHERPAEDKMQEFQQLAAECGHGLVLGKNLQQSLQQLLDEVAERPEARLLNQQLLRSLPQARYSPENKGHFGLAAECYCHFTSPIRRYPDLTVHRTLKQVLAGLPAAKDENLLELGEDCSTKERRAMLAERDLTDLRRCQIMVKHVGEEFSGTISSVTEFGFFVELDELFVDGLVHVRSLDDDFYSFDPSNLTLVGERRRTVFQVGQSVRVKVDKVDLWRRRLDFVLVETSV